MTSRQEASAEYIKKVLMQSPMPRNQVAAISGLTNTYIRDLERGIIANVAREKLISLAVALNLDLIETDRMLTIFDRASLTEGDIPIFLQTAEKGGITSALLPVRDRYALDLMMLATERIPGRHVLVSDEPPVGLRSEGHRKYSERRLSSLHAIYYELVKAIGRERRRALEANLAAHPVDVYVCPHCLANYIRHSNDPVEKKWRIEHIATVIEFVEHFPNWHFYLIESCPTFSFVLKFPDPETGEKDKCLLTSLPPHRFQGKRTGKLTGFVTDNPAVIDNFKNELAGIEQVVMKDYRDRKKLIDFLTTIQKG